ncbi:MAG: DoxX family protein [Pseudomonadales bacterium]|jgi:putative oxidoreductase
MRAFDALVEKISGFDGLPLLLIRVFLAPIMIYAGYGKLQLGADVGFFEQFLADPNVVAWFGNPDWGLGLPLPGVLAFLAAWTELIGGWLLLFGLWTRLVSLPLMFTMAVAAGTAHWDNGWHAFPEAKLTVPWEWRMDLIAEGNERKAAAIQVLKQHGNYEWLTGAGKITVLKGGIEFAATYFIMLMVLFFYGGGRYFSLDYWLALRHRDNVLS